MKKLYCLLILLIISQARFLFASEEQFLRLIDEGSIELQSEVSIPPDSAAAPSLDDVDDSGYDLNKEEERNINDKAYPLLSAKWPFNEIFVCWENPTPTDESQRSLVKTAITDTWEKKSAISFSGWDQCTPNFKGIRIKISDEGPHVRYLGKYLSYDRSGNRVVVSNGMVLNFTYQNWGSFCQTKLDYCNRVIAIHEFGHAIGFAHEQNRPNTPGECEVKPQGPDGDNVDITPWDPDSVMNSCNKEYVNNGELSDFDIKALQYIYGRGV